ncbi:MAG: hypothetical protein Q9177_004324 [Variospora cf. flavescens]
MDDPRGCMHSARPRQRHTSPLLLTSTSFAPKRAWHGGTGCDLNGCERPDGESSGLSSNRSWTSRPAPAPFTCCMLWLVENRLTWQFRPPGLPVSYPLSPSPLALPRPSDMADLPRDGDILQAPSRSVFGDNQSPGMRTSPSRQANL